jgi:glycosyltransferase involved in cell wall biosynthesis
MSSPFFSILIPTRNRASLLQTAIQSVLQQDFDDFEIVISDNCSEDNTRQVVSDFNDKRIRYIRTEEFLPIADNFEAALNHAKGKYASFLPDDDAYSKSRLKKCYELIEESKTKLLLHKFGTIYYPAGDKRFNYPPNSLTIPWFSNKVVQTASQKVIDSMYSGIQSDYYARSTVMPFGKCFLPGFDI